ncbi:MAG: hypothetical protein GY698_15730 [Actinomycetia bacterium]|nr:hypothetical protein [Actinomycetes bacterium]
MTTTAPATGRRHHLLLLALMPLALFAGMLATGTTNHSADAVAGDHGVVVPGTPRLDLPIVLDGVIWDSARVGNLIVIGGTFTQIELRDGTIVDQPYLAAYDINSGALDMSFRPALDGRVEAIEPAAEPGQVYVGGAFKKIDAQWRPRLAKLDTADGSFASAFYPDPDSYVKDIVLTGNRLIVAGEFTTIGGASRGKLASVDTTTGAAQTDFVFDLSEALGTPNGPKYMGVTPDGNTLLVVHRSRYVNGVERRMAFQVDLSGTPTLADWQTSEFDTFPPRVIDAELSPDGTYFVIATNGADFPHQYRDVAAAWSMAGGADQMPLWVTRNHDSTYAVGISDVAVYIGGHFCYTESTLAPDPWPGDLLRDHSCHGDSSAGQWVPETIYREQIAALDPATGHAIESWDPGSDAFNGIRSLEVIDRGLLVGHDGLRLDGFPVGRHGFFDLSTVQDIEDPTAAFLAPGAGDLVQGPVTLTGSASDDTTIDRVTLEVRDKATGNWVRSDGTLGLWDRLDATLASPGAASTDWSYALPVDLGSGDWQVWARAWDLAGNNTDPAPFMVFEISDGTPPDTTPPSVSYTNLVDDQEVVDPFTITGSVDDDTAVDRVTVELRQKGTNLWLQADGTLGSWTQFDAVVATPGALTSTWSVDLPAGLDLGTYHVWVRGRDAAGNFTDPSHRVKFTIGDGAPPDITAPVPVITNPTADQILNGAFVIDGSATDDRDITSVRVEVRNRDTNEWLNPDGTLGAWAPLDGVLVDNGPGAVLWSYDVASLPAGRYVVYISAFDSAVNGPPTLDDRARVKFEIT